MSASDILELELSSDPRILPGVRAELRQWALPRGWTEDQTAEMTLAIDEALSNVICHGYRGEKTHRILLSVRSVQDPEAGEGAEIRVRDFGRQVDPTRICGRDLENVRPGGLGVHIIRAMMSFVEYSPAEGGGMLLIMRKYKGHSASGQKPRGPTA